MLFQNFKFLVSFQFLFLWFDFLNGRIQKKYCTTLPCKNLEVV